MRMRRGRLLLNGLVIAAAAWMVIHGTKTHASGLLSSRLSAAGPARAHQPIATDPALAALEERAALTPEPGSIAKLAAAYLDRDQPGLASAVIEKASPDIQARPEIAH